MKVREAIERLKDFDKDAEIVVSQAENSFIYIEFQGFQSYAGKVMVNFEEVPEPVIGEGF